MLSCRKMHTITHLLRQNHAEYNKMEKEKDQSHANNLEGLGEERMTSSKFYSMSRETSHDRIEHTTLSKTWVARWHETDGIKQGPLESKQINTVEIPTCTCTQPSPIYLLCTNGPLARLQVIHTPASYTSCICAHWAPKKGVMGNET